MSLHPSVAAVRLAVRRTLADLDPGDTVVVACSGGADSLALLAATVFEATEGSWRVIGATVDHGLQDGSAEHADRVAGQMRAMGVAESVTARVSVQAPGLGPEAAAREARYAVLAEIAERFSARVVLLGHTLDDQAETVLLGLTRGSGGRALSGMRRAFEVYRRPLLDLTRADTETACLTEGIEFWTDPHNSDQEFTRVRVRTKLLPMLEAELGPGVSATLARTADLLRADTEYLDAVADAALESALERGSDAGWPVGGRVGAAPRCDPKPRPAPRRRTSRRPACAALPHPCGRDRQADQRLARPEVGRAARATSGRHARRTSCRSCATNPPLVEVQEW